MPKIVSSIGSKDIAGAGMRTFSVNDPTNSDEDFDNPQGRLRRFQAEQQNSSSIADYSQEEIMEARRRKTEELNRISEPARQRAELLIGIGRGTKDVVFTSDTDSITLSLRTLKGREIKGLMRYAATLSQKNNVTTAEASLSIRDIILSSSIYAIDGVSLDVFLNLSNKLDDEEKLSAKVIFIEDLDDSIIDKLYSEYGQLTKDNAARFAVKNEADAKEVSESIRKSGEGDKS